MKIPNLIGFLELGLQVSPKRIKKKKKINLVVLLYTEPIEI